jgi:curved DNA-binding protein CbpA
MYHFRLKELKLLKEQQGFAYFGLSADATEKELEGAYRTFAKKMHPDKNGGTEDAKRNFQTMKERYESLKKRLRQRSLGSEAGDDSDSEDAQRKRRGRGQSADNAENDFSAEGGCAGQILDGEVPPEQKSQKKRKEAYDEDDDSAGKQKDQDAAPKASSFNYDPHDRTSMCTCMFEMLGQLKGIRPQQERLARELHQASSDLYNENHSRPAQSQSRQ